MLAFVLLCFHLALAAVSAGDFSFVSYNIAGLPPVFNNNRLAGSKAQNARLIGRAFLEDGISIVHLQEDFNFHKAVYSTAKLPYRTSTSGGVPFGSGLNTLARFPWSNFKRVKWKACHANEGDCLTPKGFTYMRMHLATGVDVDLYNLHADAGNQGGDIRARESNFAQVRRWIDHYSVDHAVIVAGDMNQRYTSAAGSLDSLLRGSGLRDAWVDIVKSGITPGRGAPVSGCRVPADGKECEVVDKVLYRDGKNLRLKAMAFGYANQRFMRPDHKPLSDHNPVVVRIAWELV